ncbi:hypothetical protein AAHC03_09784 [Spirometra sp. Aus1]
MTGNGNMLSFRNAERLWNQAKAVPGAEIFRIGAVHVPNIHQNLFCRVTSQMNWSDGANFYLLKTVSIYGKNWNLVSSALSVIANTFLKHQQLNDFSDKSCSLQYKYLIASTRQTEERFSYLREENLLTIAINRYAELRREQIKQQKAALLHKLEADADENKKLLEGRFNELSPEAILTFRKRCRAFGLPDVIGEALHWDPLPPNEEEDRLVRKTVRCADNADNGLSHATMDSEGGLWIPMLPEHFRNFFPEKSHSAASPSLPFSTELPHFSSGFVEACNSTFEVDGQTGDDESSIGSPPHSKVEARTMALSDVTPVTALTPSSTSRSTKAQSCKRPSSENFNFQSLKKAAPESSPSESSDFKDVLSPASSVPTEDVFTEEMSRRIPVNKVDYQSASTVTPTRAHARSRHRSQQTSESSLSVQAQVVSAPAQSSTSASPQSSVASMGRRWRRGLLSALATVCSHRHAHIFQHAVTDDIAPGYSSMVRQPIDLTSLRRRVEASLACLAGTSAGSSESAPLSPAAGEAVIINTAKRLLRDLLLMFVNARMYNNREHSVHRMAGEMFADVFAELRPLWSVLAEDISGFPPLPGSPLPVPSTLRRRTTSSVGGVAGPTSSGPHSPQQPPTPSTIPGPSSEKAS